MATSKKTMYVAALAVAIVALAGVGYAAAVQQYTATTTNANNNLESTYIELTQTGGQVYNSEFFDKFYYDTVNSGTTLTDAATTYKPVFTHAVDVDNKTIADTGTLNYALVSKQVTVKFVHTNDADLSNVKLEIKATTPFTKIAELSYIIVMKDSTGVVDIQGYDSTKGGWIFESVSVAKGTTGSSYTFEMYIGLANSGTLVPSTAGDIGSAGFTNPVTFEFKAIVPVN